MFLESLKGKEDWARCFQSVKAFSPLTRGIYARHGLDFTALERLTPGTNAVFAVGDTVCKIFAPIESGFSTGKDFEIELAAMEHAAQRGVSVPKVLFFGEMADRYLFRYIIMQRISGVEAGEYLATATKEQKGRFAKELGEICLRLNVPIYENELIPSVWELGAERLECWKNFPEGLIVEMKAYMEKIDDAEVFVHGDLTQQNILVDEAGGLHVIDFADSHIAPRYYEWPPMILDLFGCDPILVKECFTPDERFYEDLLKGVLLHDFGGGIVQSICGQRGEDLSLLTSLEALRRRLRHWVC